MMKKLAVWMLILCLPAVGAAEIAVKGDAQNDGTNQIVRFTAEAVEEADEKQDEAEMSEEEQLAQQTLLLKVNGMLDMRFSQSKAAELYERAQRQSGGQLVIRQIPHGYSDEKVASLALVWEGEHPDGSHGCKPYSLALNLETGDEIATVDALFGEPEAAVAAMEAIIERDYLEDMNTYIEVAELLPLPRDCFSFDEVGLTVYYGDERYRTFDGQSGYVTFYWYELAQYIGEESPVYALSRQQPADAETIRAAEGFFGEHRLLGLGEPLGKAMEAYGLTDEADYTANSILYPLELPELRGCFVEIPKYAETETEDTPISAVRHTRVSWHGLTTGTTTREEIEALLGEPEKTMVYDEDDAADMMLEPGESLLYTCSNFVLEAHLDEQQVLSCVILRTEMPE
ncbi:MAG: hypothetical protein Q4G52_03680 [Clostridia bacterium]|nr:hypothetical protein [Clostridia bacterium]